MTKRKSRIVKNRDKFVVQFFVPPVEGYWQTAEYRVYGVYPGDDGVVPYTFESEEKAAEWLNAAEGVKR